MDNKIKAKIYLDSRIPNNNHKATYLDRINLNKINLNKVRLRDKAICSVGIRAKLPSLEETNHKALIFLEETSPKQATFSLNLNKINKTSNPCKILYKHKDSILNSSKTSLRTPNKNKTLKIFIKPLSISLSQIRKNLTRSKDSTNNINPLCIFKSPSFLLMPGIK